jgi:hypothetical protein
MSVKICQSSGSLEGDRLAGKAGGMYMNLVAKEVGLSLSVLFCLFLCIFLSLVSSCYVLYFSVSSVSFKYFSLFRNSSWKRCTTF